MFQKAPSAPSRLAGLGVQARPAPAGRRAPRWPCAAAPAHPAPRCRASCSDCTIQPHHQPLRRAFDDIQDRVDLGHGAKKQRAVQPEAGLLRRCARPRPPGTACSCARRTARRPAAGPTSTATVRSNTTVRKNVPSMISAVVAAGVAQVARTRATRPCSRRRTAGCRPAPPAAHARASGAASQHDGEQRRAHAPCPATGEVAPARTLVTVRAIVPVAGMPPKNGTTKLATPCAISSWFGSWRGKPDSWSATRAHSSDSTAPSSAIVMRRRDQQLAPWPSEKSGSAKLGQALRNAAEARADGFHRQAAAARPAAVSVTSATIGPGRREAMRLTRSAAAFAAWISRISRFVKAWRSASACRTGAARPAGRAGRPARGPARRG